MSATLIPATPEEDLDRLGETALRIADERMELFRALKACVTAVGPLQVRIAHEKAVALLVRLGK